MEDKERRRRRENGKVSEMRRSEGARERRARNPLERLVKQRKKRARKQRNGMRTLIGKLSTSSAVRLMFME
jgi:hypothetical protein